MRFLDSLKIVRDQIKSPEGITEEDIEREMLSEEGFMWRSLIERDGQINVQITDEMWDDRELFLNAFSSIKG